MRKVLLGLVVLSSYIFAKSVTVSILPQEYFVKQIAKEKVEVNLMVKPGESPATYEPKTSQMRILAKSDAYFSIGVPFESVWLNKFKNANRNMLIVDTAKGIKKLKMKKHEHHEENVKKHDEKAHKEHHDEHEEHKGLDPHVWLDPMLVKVQAKNIYEGLVEIDSSNKEFYLNNYKDFVAKIEKLNEKLEEILHPFEHKAFMVFHPSWGYFAKRYHLEQIAIEVQGKEPKPAQLIKLVEEAKLHNIKIVFVSPQFSKNKAEVISKSINGNTAVINPLSKNWDENLLKVAREIAKSYK
ncbi:MAG: metal ABC transporter solute-binding protein, Zn/Mn family [Campylobacterota bacterium]